MNKAMMQTLISSKSIWYRCEGTYVITIRSSDSPVLS